jgi:hypothetical protein
VQGKHLIVIPLTPLLLPAQVPMRLIGWLCVIGAGLSQGQRRLVLGNGVSRAFVAPVCYECPTELIARMEIRVFGE